MRLLANVNFPLAAVVALREKGHDVNRLSDSALCLHSVTAPTRILHSLCVAAFHGYYSY